MDFFNKAKEAAEKYTGGGDSSKKDEKKKDSDSIFSKAMDAVEKYHVKDKAVEYAQKQVAKREEEKLKPGYVEKKDKSVVDKAKEAAEDFLAKQGNKSEEPPVSKPVENPQKPRSRSSSSSSSSSSGNEKREPHPKSPQAAIVQQTTPVAPPTTTVNTGNYLAYHGEADCSDAFNRMNLDNSRVPSSTGKYETYQEYWGQRGDTQRQSNQPGYNATPSYPSQVETTSSYYSQEVPSYATRENNTTSYQGGDLYGGSDNYRREGASQEYHERSSGERDYEGHHHTTSSSSGRHQHSEEHYRRSGGERSYDERSYPNGSEAERYQTSEGYYGRSGGDARNYPSYSRDAPASGYGEGNNAYGARSVSGSYGGYPSNDHV
ncbi:hypothetical protein P3T76_008324 [Phytophthora citrophthora]|uniref:Uncharacterized protein n=1 Tax=Phytophthora citrophthora TaxID=4793 RepID=A0AAD9GKC4_9STRA|nr:hypothetical protein P3T76_008324 [Phytophthora citrophthora]